MGLNVVPASSGIAEASGSRSLITTVRLSGAVRDRIGAVGALVAS
jgi:hypothetical protein